MSAKWRALQHRHEWAYNAVNFPSDYIETIRTPECSGLPLFEKLKAFASMGSLYMQVNAAKDVASAFGTLVSESPDGCLVDSAIRLYLEILFLENSFPLHRTLISVLTKLSNHKTSMHRTFRQLCLQYAATKRFSVSRAALSLISYPKNGFLLEMLERCCIEAAFDVCNGLKLVSSDSKDGSRPSPIVMEQCQDAMSCLYYLLERFPLKFISCEVDEESSVPVLDVIFDTVFDVLKSSDFSRDCLVGAAVSLCAALQASMSTQDLAYCIAWGLFGHPYPKLAAVSDCNQQRLEYVDLEGGRLHGNSLKMKDRLSSETPPLSVLSRLCLLRGVLTTIDRPLLNMQFFLSINGHEMLWTILFDGILPELCEYSENPIDAHFNFHAITVTQIALQQVKASFMSDLVKMSSNYAAFSDSLANRILRIIWNNLEDPLNQTVKQVHLIFELLLDIQFMVLNLSKQDPKTLYFNIAGDLLHLSGRCKGRYVPLASLAQRLGANSLLNMHKDILTVAVQAYIDDDVCCAVTTFLKCFLTLLRDECWQNHGIERGYMSFRLLALPPVLCGLISGLSKLRSNLSTYALPLILDVDVDSIFLMIDYVVNRQDTLENFENWIHTDFELGIELPLVLTEDQRVISLVSLLKAARSLALIEGEIGWWHDPLSNDMAEENEQQFAAFLIKGIEIKVPVVWLESALSHVDDILRIDAAESLFLNPKTASLPSQLELILMKKTIPLNMRCSSTAFQMKWTSLFKKFFSRVRTALERQVKIGLKQQSRDSKNNMETVELKALHLFRFVKWLSCFLFFSCYPSAPYERKIMAMDLLLTMIGVWPIKSPNDSLENLASTHSQFLYPYSIDLVSPDSTLSLVGSVVDSWDKLRESSIYILFDFPTPLPGICDEEKVREVIVWAKGLVRSPRVRESDAGALTLRLIFRKYVLELGWMVNVFDDVVRCRHADIFKTGSNHTKSNGFSKTCFPVSEYLSSFVVWLQVSVEEGEKDLSKACQNSFVHGILLSLRYTFEELDWNSELVTRVEHEMKNIIAKLLDLMAQITSLSVWVVSSDAWYMADDLDNQIEDASLLADFTFEASSDVSLGGLHNMDSKHVKDTTAAEHLVMVGCWLAMKEVSLLLGTITKKIPLPSSMAEDPKLISSEVLDACQLQTIGDNFLQVLLSMKHNGAIDKTRAGFTALCNRLLCSNNARLCRMTVCWMEQLMKRTTATGQTVDDLLRRSAGIPAAFIALFLAEPEGTPKKLLPQALRWLIDLTKTSLVGVGEDTAPNFDLKNVGSPMQVSMLGRMGEHERVFKVRDEGVIPIVHAFNVLRSAFNDKNLATDTSGFSAEALIVSISAFSSPYWEVRNSACLAYTALVRRMVGFFNVHKRESARRALSGLEFFHRYPTLHLFVLDTLKAAADWIADVNQQYFGDDMDLSMHPSLWPVLILLSRLKPSVIGPESKNELDPFLFMPFLRKCATQRNQRIRILASKALSGVVSNERLLAVILYVASGLPCTKSLSAMSGCTCSVIASYDMLRGTEVEKEHVTSSNAIHGILLQLSSLITVNCRDMTDITKKDQILSELFLILIDCSWIGNIKSCACPTLVASYLQLLAHMLEIARSCGMSNHTCSIQKVLMDLTSQCWEDSGQCQPSLKFSDPTLLELQKRAVGHYFDCFLGWHPGVGLSLNRSSKTIDSLNSSPVLSELQQSNAFNVMFLSSISDVSYELRITALKGTFHFLKSIGSMVSNAFHGTPMEYIVNWFNVNLHPTMLQILDVEENPKCVSYILKILFCWNDMQWQKSNALHSKEVCGIGNMDFPSLSLLWEKLMAIKKTARYIRTSEILLCCMGVCVKKWIRIFQKSAQCNAEGKFDPVMVENQRNWSDAYDSIHYFVVYVMQCSSSSEPVNMRRAAADALVASGLLEQAAWVGSMISNDQMHCNQRHEDRSDNGIVLPEKSNGLYLHAIDVLESWFTCIKLLEDEDVSLRHKLGVAVQRCIQSSLPEAVPMQVDKVIVSTFEFLSSTFCDWLVYVDQLSKYAIVDLRSYSLGGGDLVRRIFDKEIDNHHEEKLLTCQICFSHLERLLTGKVFSDPAYGGSLNGSKHADFCVCFDSFLHKRRREILCQTIGMLKLVTDTENAPNWIGGLGNHKDVFLPLYSSLLGLYAFSHVNNKVLLEEETDQQSSLMSGFVELGHMIIPFLRNPLIANIYFLVIKSYEKVSSTLSQHANQFKHMVWEDFDPYFLL